MVLGQGMVILLGLLPVLCGPCPRPVVIVMAQVGCGRVVGDDPVPLVSGDLLHQVAVALSQAASFVSIGRVAVVDVADPTMWMVAARPVLRPLGLIAGCGCIGNGRKQAMAEGIELHPPVKKKSEIYSSCRWKVVLISDSYVKFDLYFPLWYKV